MKALVYMGPGKHELTEIEACIPKVDEALVKITASGICGSDVEGFLGKTGRRTEPMIMGHELAGIISKPAEKNSCGLKAGDKVVVFPKFYCGVCPACEKGLVNICPDALALGVLACNGGNTEYIAVKEKYLMKVDAKLDDVTLALVEPLAVANHAVRIMLELSLKKDDWIMIVGAGTIGMFILQILKIHGYSHIIMADLSSFRLQLAENMGAFVVNPAEQEDIISAIKSITHGSLVTCSFEAVGMEKTADLSLSVLHMGGYAVWVGNAQKNITVNMQAIVTREKRILGSFLYTLEDFEDSINYIQNNHIDTSIISAVVSLEDSAEWFDTLAYHNRDGKLLKVVIVPGGQNENPGT